MSIIKKCSVLSVFLLLLAGCSTSNEQTGSIKEELTVGTYESNSEKTSQSETAPSSQTEKNNGSAATSSAKNQPTGEAMENDVLKNSQNPDKDSNANIANAHYRTIREISRTTFEQNFGEMLFFNVNEQPIGAEEIYSDKISGTNILAVNIAATAYILDVTLYPDDQTATEAFNKIVFEKITPELAPVESVETVSKNTSKSYARFGDEESYGYALIIRDYNALIIVNKTPHSPPPFDDNLKNDLVTLSSFVYEHLEK